ncbi:MAG: type II toxin-antitoxin system Phd/YefM family antitoxin [Actinomycetota bacterium]
MKTVAVSAARAELPALLDRVTSGEEVTITRHGRPVAVLVRPDSLRFRKAGAALASAGRVREALKKGRQAPLPSAKGLTRKRAEDLIAEVQKGRDRR